MTLAEQADGRWLGMAVLLFFASVCLTLGLPALMSLFERRGRRLGTVAVGVLAVGTIGLAAYGMLLVFLRVAILNDFARVDRLELRGRATSSDPRSRGGRRRQRAARCGTTRRG